MFGVSKKEFDRLKNRVVSLEKTMAEFLIEETNKTLKPKTSIKKSGYKKKKGRKRTPRAIKQANWKAKGLCIQCGNKATIKKDGKPSTMCRKHMKAQTERSRRYKKKQ